MALNQQLQDQHMETTYNLIEVFRSNAQVYALANTRNHNKPLASKFIDVRAIEPQTILQQIINTLGKASASAQAIKQPITTYDKFLFSSDRLYIAVEHPNKVVGILRVGPKTLFYFHPKGEAIKLDDCLCVLDFYVAEQCQRRGYGKKLFECFQRIEGAEAHKLAFDRPSYKMLNFLKKHYGLKDFVSQNNNFVIFNNFFTNQPGVPAPNPPRELRNIQPVRRSEIAQEQDRLYQSAQRDLLNKRNSMHSSSEFESSQNESRSQYKHDFKNSMVSSARTNMIFKSIQKLSLDKSSPIGFGYTGHSFGERVNPAIFRIHRNELDIQQAGERIHQADDQLERLKHQIKDLECIVRPEVIMPSSKTSSDYGRFIRRR